MFLVLRFLPILSALTFLAVSLVTRFYPSFLMIALAIVSILPVITTALFVKITYNTHVSKAPITYWIKYSAIALGFILPILGVLLFINNIVLFGVILFIGALLHFVYLEDLFIYLFYPQRYLEHSLDYIQQYSALIWLTLSATAGFGLISFIKLPLLHVIGPIILAFLAGVLLLVHYNRLFEGKKYQVLIISSLTLMAIQVFVVLAYLPSSMFMKGGIMGILYYGFQQYFILKESNPPQSTWYRLLALTLLPLCLILVTSNWF